MPDTDHIAAAEAAASVLERGFVIDAGGPEPWRLTAPEIAADIRSVVAELKAARAVLSRINPNAARALRTGEVPEVGWYEDNETGSRTHVYEVVGCVKCAEVERGNGRLRERIAELESRLRSATAGDYPATVEGCVAFAQVNGLPVVLATLGEEGNKGNG